MNRKSYFSTLSLNDEVRITTGNMEEYGKVEGIYNDALVISNSDGRCTIFYEAIQTFLQYHKKENISDYPDDYFQETTYRPEEYSKTLYDSDEEEKEIIIRAYTSTDGRIPAYTFPKTNDYTFDVNDLLKKISKEKNNLNLNSVTSSIESALQTGSLPSKLHDIRRSIILRTKFCKSQEDHGLIDLLLGLLLYLGEEYETATTHFTQCKAYIPATCSALKENKESVADQLKITALLSGEESVRMTQDIGKIILRYEDISPLYYLLENLDNDLDILSDFTGYLLEALSIPNDIFFDGQKESIREALSLFPESWGGNHYLSDLYRSSEQSNTYLTSSDQSITDVSAVKYGKIVDFNDYNPKAICGHVQTAEGDRHFFSIHQVSNDTPYLRFALKENLYRDLEVSFVLGEHKDNVMAGELAFTSEAIETLQSRLNTQPSQGFIACFIEEQRWGVVQSGGVNYNFILDSILDPDLYTYMTSGFNVEGQDVSFSINQYKGKETAINIMAEPPLEKWKIQGCRVDPQKLLDFERFKSNQREYGEPYDPYSTYNYYYLTPINTEVKLMQQHTISPTEKAITPIENPTINPRYLAVLGETQKAETLVQQVFGQVFPDFFTTSCKQYIEHENLYKRRFQAKCRGINLDYDKVLLNAKRCLSLKGDIPIIYSFSFQFLVTSIIELWDTTFANKFKQDDSWKSKLRLIVEVRNQLAHPSSDYVIEEEKLDLCAQYCAGLNGKIG